MGPLLVLKHFSPLLKAGAAGAAGRTSDSNVPGAKAVFYSARVGSIGDNATGLSAALPDVSLTLHPLGPWGFSILVSCTRWLVFLPEQQGCIESGGTHRMLLLLLDAINDAFWNFLICCSLTWSPFSPSAVRGRERGREREEHCDPKC